MSILAAIRPKEPLRHLRWFDMLIVTAIPVSYTHLTLPTIYSV